MKNQDLLPTEFLNLINPLCDVALKGAGVQAYQIVKQVEAWLQTEQVKNVGNEEKA